jgi:hypothetical protein
MSGRGGHWPLPPWVFRAGSRWSNFGSSIDTGATWPNAQGQARFTVPSPFSVCRILPAQAGAFGASLLESRSAQR